MFTILMACIYQVKEYKGEHGMNLLQMFKACMQDNWWLNTCLKDYSNYRNRNKQKEKGKYYDYYI